MNEAAFRRLALGFPGVEERSHMGHPDFRAGGRIFATLRGDGRHGMVKLTPEQQQTFVRDEPDAFTPESGAWGRQGCTRVALAAVDEETLGEAMTLAWGNVGPTAQTRRAGRAGTTTGARQTRAESRARVALLRAVNVAGVNAVSMETLRRMVEKLGFAEPRTLLQSGNVVFRASGADAAIERKLEESAARQLKLATEFFVRGAREWAAIVAANPFRDVAERDPGRLLLLVAKGRVSAADVRTLATRIVGREVVAPGDRHVYIVYPDGVGRSRLTTASVEKALDTRVTGRNWNTVLKIAAALGV